MNVALEFDTIYLCAKFGDSSFSQSRDINGDPKFQIGHMTVTTPLLNVICPPYAVT